MMGRPEEILAMVLVLAADLGDAGSRLKSNDTPTARRAFVRAVFALIEGTAFFVKNAALERADASKMPIDNFERSLVLERQSFLTDSGKVKSRRTYPREIPNLLYAFDLAGRVCGEDFGNDHTSLVSRLRSSEN